MKWERPAIQGIEVCYALLPEFCGIGFATEAARAVRDYPFDAIGINKLLSLVEKGNKGSIKWRVRFMIPWSRMSFSLAERLTSIR